MNLDELRKEVSERYIIRKFNGDVVKAEDVFKCALANDIVNWLEHVDVDDVKEAFDEIFDACTSKPKYSFDYESYCDLIY